MSLDRKNARARAPEIQVTSSDENRWDDDGGGFVPYREVLESNPVGIRTRLTPQSAVISLPRFDHKEPEDDDCGLPQHPIYANYSRYLWTSHKRSGGAQIISVDERIQLHSLKKAA